jgi:hypothetical protein
VSVSCGTYEDDGVHGFVIFLSQVERTARDENPRHIRWPTSTVLQEMMETFMSTKRMSYLFRIQRTRLYAPSESDAGVCDRTISALG